MPFELIAYLSEVGARLEVLSPRKRLAFALCCSEPLIENFSDYLGARIGSSKLDLLRKTVDTLWHSVVSGTDVPASDVALVDETVASATWPEEEVASDEEFLAFGSVELLGGLQSIFETFETGSAQSAADAAEHVINVTDYELSMVDGVEDPGTASRFQQEIKRQQRILTQLEIGHDISASDRNQFRT